MSSGLRLQGWHRPGARVALVRVVRTQDVVSSAKTDLGHALRSADDWAGEFWETLSYGVIWLCGLIGIGLCFL